MKTLCSWRPRSLTLATALVVCATATARAGTLGASVAVPIAPDTSQIVAVDLTGAGRDDLVTTIPERGLIGILVARADGTFGNLPALSVAYGGQIGAADFTGDGRNDLVYVQATPVSAPAGTALSVFPGHGDGT